MFLLNCFTVISIYIYIYIYIYVCFIGKHTVQFHVYMMNLILFKRYARSVITIQVGTLYVSLLRPVSVTGKVILAPQILINVYVYGSTLVRK